MVAIDAYRDDLSVLYFVLFGLIRPRLVRHADITKTGAGFFSFL
jgi:hypothetical protein